MGSNQSGQSGNDANILYPHVPFTFMPEHILNARREKLRKAERLVKEEELRKAERLAKEKEMRKAERAERLAKEKQMRKLGVGHYIKELRNALKKPTESRRPSRETLNCIQQLIDALDVTGSEALDLSDIPFCNSDQTSRILYMLPHSVKELKLCRCGLTGNVMEFWSQCHLQKLDLTENPHVLNVEHGWWFICLHMIRRLRELRIGLCCLTDSALSCIVEVLVARQTDLELLECYDRRSEMRLTRKSKPTVTRLLKTLPKVKINLAPYPGSFPLWMKELKDEFGDRVGKEWKP